MAIAIAGILLMISVLCFSACQPKTYTIAFETDGGTTITAIEAEAGASITAPDDPIKAGYVFDGWYLNKDFSGNREEIPDTMPSENRTYYAKWVEEQKATLTLDVGRGGSIENTSLTAPVGTSLKSLLNDKTPTVTAGVRFDGWYLRINGSWGQISDSDKLIAEGVTVYARYKTDVTVKSYIQAATSEYPTDSEDSVVEAYLGEAYTFSGNKEHFTIDTEKSTVTLSEVTVGSSLSVYYKRDIYKVTYDVNAPLGVEVEGKVEEVSALYEANITLSDGSGLTIDSDLYRFIGWSSRKEGPVEYEANAEFKVDTYTTLYAVWAKALTDAFGGGDLLFVLTSDKAVIVRQNVAQELDCEFNAASGIFTIKESGKEIASGKVLDESFYYFKDFLQLTYVNAADETSSLQLNDKGVAVYTVGGNTVNGSYDIDEETGDWIFESDSDNFVFSVDIISKTFVIADDSRGTYVFFDGTDMGYPLIFIDGMSEAQMIYPFSSPYVDSLGVPYTVLEGTFTFDPESESFMIRVRAGADGYLAFYVYIDKKEVELSGEKYQGAYSLLGMVPGWYSVNAYMGEEPDLFINGRGRGKYQGREGSYELRELGWYTTTLGVNEINHDYIVFNVDDSDDRYIFVLRRNDDGTLDYDLLESEPECHNYDIDGLFLNGIYYSDAMLYFRDGRTTGVAELWVYNEEYSEAYGLDIYDSICSGDFYKYEGTLNGTAGDYYRFNGSYWNSDYSHFFTFNEDGTLHFSIAKIILNDKLYISQTGKAYYTPDGGVERAVEYEIFEVAVGVTDITGIKKIYLFDLGENGVPDIYAFKASLEEDGTESIEAVAKTDFLDVGYLAHNTFGARIILLPENKAIIAALVSAGTYTVYFYGDITELENGEKQFDFTFNGYPYEDGGAFTTQYGSFRFKAQEAIGGYVFVVNDLNPLNIECEAGKFVTDGFGNATITIDGVEKKGFYRFVANLIEVDVSDTQEEYIYVKVLGKDSFKIIDLEKSAEAGYIYAIDNGYLVTSVNIFFDGDKTAIYTTEESVEEGTYEYIGIKVLDGLNYEEYKITFADDREMTIIVITGSVGEQGYRVFYLRDESGVIDIATGDGGTIVGDGYDYANYTTSEGEVLLGFANYGVLADEQYYNHSYAATPDGNVIIFRVLDDSLTSVTQELVFDLVEKDGNTVAVLRELPFGLNIRFENNTLVYNNYLYLDGKGNAEIRSNYGEYYDVTETGTYEAKPELGENIYIYKSSDTENTFVFSMRIELQYSAYTGIMYIYEYCVFDADTDNTYYSDGYTILKLDGFGNGVYVDKYGVVYNGTYAKTVSENTIAFNVLSSEDRYYFNLYKEGSKFESANIGDFVVYEDILIAYVGSETSIAIPDGVKRIMANAIPNTVTAIDFNDVEILDDNALVSHFGLTHIESDKIKKVGANALSGTYATEIILPAAEDIGDGAFMMNSQLTRLVLGKVKKIGARILSRSNYMSTLVIDLTAVEDLNAIEMDETAFDLDQYATYGLHLYFQRILVKDMTAVNTIMSSAKWSAAAKNFVYFADDATDFDGSTYFSLKSQTIYRLDKAVIKDVKTEEGLMTSEVKGLYTVTNGKLNLYNKKADGTFETTPVVIDDANTLEFENDTFFKSAVALKRNYEDKELTFTIIATLSSENYFSQWRDIYTFSGNAVYEGATASNFTFDYDNFAITFVTDEGSKAYYVTEITDKTCKIEYRGLLLTKEAQFGGYKHTVIFSMSEDYHITSVQQVLRDFGWGNPSNIDIANQKANEDGSVEFELSEWQATNWFRMVYDSATDSITVTVFKLTRILSATVTNDDSTSDTYQLNVVMDDKGTLLDVLSFQKGPYPYVDWTIDDTTVNEDGTLTIEVTDAEGTKHTFTASIAPAGTYPDINFTLTLTEEK